MFLLPNNPRSATLPVLNQTATNIYCLTSPTGAQDTTQQQKTQNYILNIVDDTEKSEGKQSQDCIDYDMDDQPLDFTLRRQKSQGFECDSDEGPVWRPWWGENRFLL